jgi:hypothetical protein
MFSFFFSFALSSPNSRCRRWARPLNYTLSYVGYYEAIEKVAYYVCQNDTAPAVCRPQMVQRMLRYPLDFLMEKGSKQFCTEIFDKSPKGLMKSRAPQCHWCLSAVAVFDLALKDRGMESASNLTSEFCAKTSELAPQLLPYCETVVSEWGKRQSGREVCRRCCAAEDREEV